MLKEKAARTIILVLLTIFAAGTSFAQSTGCVAGRFGIDAGLYSGVIEYGTAGEPSSPRSNDWFQGAAGFGVISEANKVTLQALLQGGGNPTYLERMVGDKVRFNDGQIWIDALYARDQFGGTGFQDPTSFNTASKNGEDPAIWDPGQQNVLGKNDIIDVGGFMFRDGTSLTTGDLWFVGLFNMAEPGGTSYMDFEFYVNPIELVPRPGGGILFTSGGPQLGHTAYTFDGPGNITKIGDFIFSVALEGAGVSVEIRLWVSRADWTLLNGPTQGSTATFQWTGTFDGAFNNAPYGYAGIKELPPQAGLFCGYVNRDGETPIAPPWGSKGTKTNSYITNYIPNSIAEVGINLTAFGMDHSSLSGVDPCFFPLNTFLVKTRASASFTAQLKDFAGPYGWGQPTVSAFTLSTDISCDNPTATITVIPERHDVNYLWSTLDGNIMNLLPYVGNEDAQAFLIADDDLCLTDPLIECTYLYAIDVDPNKPWEIEVDQAGTYRVSIFLPTDCPVIGSEATVTYDSNFPFFDGPPAFSYTVPCNTNDGTITVTASGATKPYTFFLYKDNVLQTQVTKNATESSHTFTGLTAGNYRVDVKGVYACIETSGPFSIPERIPVVVDESLTHVDCFGDTTGAINLDVTGGNPPLSYSWSTGNTSQNLLNIGAGSYTITITDADGCETIETYIITQPGQIEGVISKTDDPGNDSDGSASISASGGTPGYTYLWTKTGDPAFLFTPSDNVSAVTKLSYGEYTVTVTDAEGCFRTFSVFIYEKEICYDGIDNDGDGLTDCDDPDCKPATPLSLTPDEPLPCVGEVVTYTVQLPVGVTYDSFVWTVPANTVITSAEPHSGPSITLYWTSTAGGQICVRGKIFDCLSAAVCITVEVDDIPAPPSEIIIENN